MNAVEAAEIEAKLVFYRHDLEANPGAVLNRVICLLLLDYIDWKNSNEKSEVPTYITTDSSTA